MKFGILSVYKVYKSNKAKELPNKVSIPHESKVMKNIFQFFYMLIHDVRKFLLGLLFF